MNAIVIEEQTGNIGLDGVVYDASDESKVVVFPGGEKFRENSAFNASCLHRWIIESISKYVNRDRVCVDVAVGEATTNAFKHCATTMCNCVAVSAKIACEDGHVKIELVNLSEDCPTCKREMPDGMSESKFGIPTIMYAQDQSAIKGVSYDPVELEGHKATRFVCEVCSI